MKDYNFADYQQKKVVSSPFWPEIWYNCFIWSKSCLDVYILQSKFCQKRGFWFSLIMIPRVISCGSLGLVFSIIFGLTLAMLWTVNDTRHGLRMPNEAFFHCNPILLGLGRQIWQINTGAFGVFSAKLSTPNTVSPLSIFSLIQPLFLQKTKPSCVCSPW